MGVRACLGAAGTLVVVLLLLGCGSTAAPAPQTLVLQEADAGRTVQVRAGDTIQVKLVESFPVPGSSLVWEVTSSTPSVLAPSKVTRDPAELPRIGQVAYTAEFSASAARRSSSRAARPRARR